MIRLLANKNDKESKEYLVPIDNKTAAIDSYCFIIIATTSNSKTIHICIESCHI